jgi:hypothetical protein
MAQYEKMIAHRHWRVTYYDADVIESFHLLNFPEGPSITRDGTVWHTGPLFQDWNSINGLALPDPHADAVYDLLKADFNEFPNKAVLLNVVTPFGVIANMRTYELVYMDICEFPEQFKILSRRIADILKVVIESACKMGITALYIQEDLATSKGLAMSHSMINEFSLDYAKEFIEIAKAYGKPVLFHSDGAVLDLVEPLISMGISAINPLQHNVIDALEFKAKFKKMNINSNVDYSKSLLNEVIHYSMKDGRVSYLFNSEQVSRLNKFFRDVLGDDSCVEIIPDINDLGDVTLFEVRGARTFDRKEKTLVNKKLRSRGYVC